MNHFHIGKNARGWLGWLSVCLLLCSCQQGQHHHLPEITHQTRRIFVLDQEFLYFTNVRSLYYHMEKNESTQIKTYTFKGADSLSISLRIDYAYLRKEAYVSVMFYPEIRDSIAIRWHDPANRQSGDIWFSPGRPVEDYLMVKKLVQWYAKGVELWIGDQPVFSPQAYEACRVVLEDYHKLISVK
jgi:hypothetical protein